MRPSMVFCSPAPSTIVVLSLSMVTRLARPRSSDLDAFQLDAGLFHDGLAAGEDRDVLEHGLAAVAEAGRLDGGDVQRATQLVHDEGGQRFAFHFLGDDEQRAGRSGRSARARAAGPSCC